MIDRDRIRAIRDLANRPGATITPDLVLWLASEVESLADLAEELERDREVACIEADPACECAGCLLARERAAEATADPF